MKPEKIFAISVLVVVVCVLITIVITKGTRHEPRIIDKRVNVEDTKQYQINSCQDSLEILKEEIQTLKDSIDILHLNDLPIPMSKMGYYLDDLEQMKIRYDFYKSEYERLKK